MTNSDCKSDFSFPFNVCARLIELEEGVAEYVHYGIFDHPQEATSVAQQRAAEMLWDRLPPPCKTLDVGIGLGTTLLRLSKAGYLPTGITPDTAQIRHAQNLIGNAAPLIETCFEDFKTEPGSWGLILFQESAQSIDPIDLLEGVDRLLSTDGEVIIMDEFALRRSTPGREALHYLPHFLAAAERFGLAVIESVDLSVQAMPTLDWLLKAVNHHAGLLKDELGISNEQIELLTSSNRRYAEQYSSGAYGYFLLRLKRIERPRWRPGRIIGDTRASEMRTLFSQVFGQQMSDEHWEWKYGHGRGAGIGVWRQEDGKLVAHYGGLTREIMLFGKPERAFLACDLMVAETDRGSLTRKGPAYLAAATFLEHELGYGAPHLLGIGFPNARAYALPVRLGLYVGSVARIQEVYWPGLDSRPSLNQKVREIDLQTPSGSCIADICWQQMCGAMRELVIGLRDTSYLRHRYVAHPDKKYRVFHVQTRLSKKSLGLFILRFPDNPTNRRCELLDLVGHPNMAPTLIRHARRIARSFDFDGLYAWFSDNVLPILSLPKEATIKDVDVVVPGNNWTTSLPNELVTGKWWLTGGDTDML